MKHYFVSYIAVDKINSTTHYGHCEVKRDGLILSMDDIISIANAITTNNKFSNMVTITNFIELRKGSK